MKITVSIILCSTNYKWFKLWTWTDYVINMCTHIDIDIQIHVRICSHTWTNKTNLNSANWYLFLSYLRISTKIKFFLLAFHLWKTMGIFRKWRSSKCFVKFIWLSMVSAARCFQHSLFRWWRLAFLVACEPACIYIWNVYMSVHLYINYCFSCGFSNSHVEMRAATQCGWVLHLNFWFR